MNKKFFTNGQILKVALTFALLSIVCFILSFVLKNVSNMFVILISFVIYSGGGAALLLILLFFNCWIVEINEQGILYRNLFKFRKFKRFFRWEEIDEIEIIKIKFLNLKQTYFTRGHFLYGQKRFMNMKNCPDVIILNAASKKIQEEVKKYYSKNIIMGRNFKIAIAQEEIEEQEK